MNHNLSVRAKIILTLEKINQGQSLSVLLDPLLNSLKDNEKGFAHELLLGTLRQWWALSRIGESLIKQPPSDMGVICALNMGLYELLYMHTPDYAVINETLNAVKAVNKPYGVGLINAILRKVADKKDKFAKKVQKNHSLPNHLAKQLKQDWAENYETLGQVLRTPAPIFVRANTAKISHDDYIKQLTNVADVQEVTLDGKIDFDNTSQTYTTQAIKLSGGQMANLTGFDDGLITVQDLHAQLSGAIVSSVMSQFDKPVPNLLDACTAPAGKLTHWLAKLTDGTLGVGHDFALTAIDNDKNRLKRVYDNIDRLGFAHLLDDKLFVKVADATTLNGDTPFDVVMLDAPCSATGVIRRHPDINLLRTPADIEKVVALQAVILDNLWSLVAQGGFLLYITCSVLKAENETQMTNFLARHHDATEIKLYGDWGLPQNVGRQCLPQMDGGDGFYYALVRKS
ncbi:transcription antitermination factor NusB [Moraxella sp. VT-16-12]|uniref:transcription antitermination factor NusB n=1 Tax=Moraxella sp. VT-16-12 TaxID=2014877 RepID=UPI000B7CD7AF|nr:transcription antitermination factor NusB [Moraxella sp. VT-16-12]TWV82508.1 16S rRNA (cytosine(967)-C(5))-methyltransferase RsmB [Moraxella sp. VT-16-12]